MDVFALNARIYPVLWKKKTTRYELLMILAFRKLIYSSLVEIWKKTRSITQYRENEPGNSACLQRGNVSCANKFMDDRQANSVIS
jgi:hypothetical protein